MAKIGAERQSQIKMNKKNMKKEGNALINAVKVVTDNHL